jgi:hypothetical protein
MKKSPLASFSRLARLEYRRPWLQQCDFENLVRLCAYLRTVAQPAKFGVTQMPRLRWLVNCNGYREGRDHRADASRI